jgi:site-specific recombinase XerD
MLGRNFNVRFLMKSEKTGEHGPQTIYMRVIVNGTAKDLTTSRKCDRKAWLTNLDCTTGKGQILNELNEHLQVLKMRAFEARRVLLETNKEVTAMAVKLLLTGGEEKQRMVLEIFEEHNKKMETLVNIDYAPGTMERYRTSLAHTKAFILWKYKCKDLPISKLDYEFADQYEYWLKSVQKCSHNTSIKYVANFKKIVNHCIRCGWLSRDPFLGYKMSKKEVKVVPLTQEEIALLKSKEFVSERVNQVRDIFLFCCFTGLAYADVFKLKRSEINIGVDGGKWIFTSRQKTDSDSHIPLLPQALEIMDKYADHPQCRDFDRMLPVLSNQKMNSYLKEIADICGITKKFTTHIARHTFATTITLGNGVPIETVSKMLGHKNLKTTQHYAKILDMKVSEDMANLKNKLKAV